VSGDNVRHYSQEDLYITGKEEEEDIHVGLLKACAWKMVSMWSRRNR